MTITLSYGSRVRMQLELPWQRLLAQCDAPPGTADPRAAVRAALESPLDFPSIAKAVYPGDKVVLALGPDLPLGGVVASEMARLLVDCGVSPSDLSLLYSDQASYQRLSDETASAPLPDEIAHVVHDAKDRDRLAMLAIVGKGNSLYLNRTLTDADIVFPIGCLRGETSLGYLGPAGALCPAFCDEKTQKTFQQRFAAGGQDARSQANEIGWLLGVQFFTQVATARDGEILGVLAGESKAVARGGQQLWESAWCFDIPRRADLVVATVEGGPDQQTWANVARAAAMALSAVEEGGAIALCCELDAPPDASFELTAGAVLFDPKRRGEPTDSKTVDVFGQTSVYLLSRLANDVVEDLGMTPVANAEEISRLATQHGSCLFVAAAQYAGVRVAGA